jgi:hypothetical protein
MFADPDAVELLIELLKTFKIYELLEILKYTLCWAKSLLFRKENTYELFAFALDLSQKEKEVPSG